MIRLLMVVSSDLHPGLLQQLLQVAERLRRAQFEVEFCVAVSPRGACPSLFDHQSSPPRVIVFRGRWDVAAWRELFRVATTGGFDQLHVVADAANFPLLALTRLTKPPVIVSISGCQRKNHHLATWFLSRSANLFGRQIGIGDASATPMETGLDGIQPHDLPPVILPTTAWETTERRSGVRAGSEPIGLRRRLGLSDSARLIGIVAPLLPNEGLKDAIWATDLLNNVWDDVHLLIAGDGPQRQRLVRFIGQTEMTQRVHLLRGADAESILDEIEFYWQTANRAENTYFLASSMLRGRAVLASDTILHRRLIEPGRTGQLFPIGNRAMLARQTHALLEDPNQRRRLGEAARAEMAARLDADACLLQWTRFYQTVRDR